MVRHRATVSSATVKPKRAANCAPRSTRRVLRKGVVIHMAQEAPAEVLPAAEEVQHLTGEHVLHQGVDGEIPAAGGSLRPQPRVHLHGEVPVAPAHGGLPPGHGDVQSAARQPVDAEADPTVRRPPIRSSTISSCWGVTP